MPKYGLGWTTAKYPGVCKLCNRAFHKGDRIISIWASTTGAYWASLCCARKAVLDSENEYLIAHIDCNETCSASPHYYSEEMPMSETYQRAAADALRGQTAPHDPIMLYADHTALPDGRWSVNCWPLIGPRSEAAKTFECADLRDACKTVLALEERLATFLGHSFATLWMLDGEPTQYVMRALSDGLTEDRSPA